MIDLMDPYVMALVALNASALLLFLIFGVRPPRRRQPAAHRNAAPGRSRGIALRLSLGSKRRDRQVDALLREVDLTGSDDRFERSARSAGGTSRPAAAESCRQPEKNAILGSLI